MFKLIKYDIKSDFKKLIGVLSAIIIANLLLFTRIGVWQRAFILALSFMVAFAASVVTLIYSIKLLSRYVYSESGYLMFTLPQPGYSILSSRLITAVIENFIVCAVGFVFIFININAIPLIKVSVLDYINLKVVLEAIGIAFWELISILMYIYFSIIVSKVAFRNRKYGKAGAFIVFIIMSVIVGKIAMELEQLFPQAVIVGGKFDQQLLNSASMGSCSVNSGITNVNIATAIFDIVAFIILFAATSYLIDNKMDM